jgi:hypothetical protein
MAVNFPASPTNGQTFTSGGITWTYSTSVGAWEIVPSSIQGVQGIQGTNGFQGIQGTQGRQGIQGANGFQGIQGTQSANGFQGIQGITGFQGIQGIQSANGFQGIQGTTGGGSGGASVFSANVGNASANTFNVAHNLAKTFVIPAVRENSSGYYVYPDMKYTTPNHIVLEFVTAPSTNQYTVIVLG